MEASEHSWSNRSEDDTVEAAVLQLILDLHPTLLTVAELVREIAGERLTFAERDAVERAVRDLVAAGLLHEGDKFAIPTRAAVRFSELLDR